MQFWESIRTLDIQDKQKQINPCVHLSCCNKYTLSHSDSITAIFVLPGPQKKQF
jgi:hypothetical protein